MSQGYHHITVMADEALEILNVVSGGVYLDATFGGGGHSERILEKGGRVIALDLDDEAIENAHRLKERFGDRFSIFKGNFKEAFKFCRMAGVERVDGVIADLGLSSNQLEQSGRGFSFMRSEPLDMRFDRTASRTAYELLSELSVEDIAYTLKTFADIERDTKVAGYLKEYFSKGMPNDALSFAEYIRGCRFIKRNRRIDPATRVFMAIRMLVNNEVDNLTTFLARLPMIVKNDTRVVVIAFHSVEDRIVKNIFRKFVRQDLIETEGIRLRAELLIKKVIRPSERERRSNPRSRSAKMRAIRFLRIG
jgi:16S rRNA (cytosine1402-N4)-methyltransferase